MRVKGQRDKQASERQRGRKDKQQACKQERERERVLAREMSEESGERRPMDGDEDDDNSRQ